jgi:hypothetical protein
MMPGALIPSGQHKPRVVATVVIMQMSEKQVTHLLSRNSKLHQSMMCAESMIKNYHIIADLCHIARAHSPQRGRGRARSQ